MASRSAPDANAVCPLHVSTAAKNCTQYAIASGDVSAICVLRYSCPCQALATGTCVSVTKGMTRVSACCSIFMGTIAMMCAMLNKGRHGATIIRRNFSKEVHQHLNGWLSIPRSSSLIACSANALALLSLLSS